LSSLSVSNKYNAVMSLGIGNARIPWRIVPCLWRGAKLVSDFVELTLNYAWHIRSAAPGLSLKFARRSLYRRDGQIASAYIPLCDFKIDSVLANSDNAYSCFSPLVPEQARAQPNPKLAEVALKPGMTATMDIRTGQRSVLKYLAKPVDKAFAGALNER